jgi:hypothetical protein
VGLPSTNREIKIVLAISLPGANGRFLFFRRFTDASPDRVRGFKILFIALRWVIHGHRQRQRQKSDNDSRVHFVGANLRLTAPTRAI